MSDLLKLYKDDDTYFQIDQDSNVKTTGNLNVEGTTTYDNTDSGLTSTDVKSAIDEVAEEVSGALLQDGTRELTADWDSGSFSVTLNAPIIADAPLVETPVAGKIEFDDDRIYITDVATQRAIDRTSDVILETSTVSETNVATTIFTGIFGANSLKTGNVIKVHCNGTLSNDSAADDLTFEFYIGSQLIVSIETDIGNVTDAHWHLDGDYTIRSEGETGSMAYHFDADVANTETEEIDITTINTLVPENVTVKITWDNAKATNVFNIYQGYVEYKN